MSHKPGVVLCALLSHQEVHLNGQTFSFVSRKDNESLSGVYKKIKGRKRKWIRTEISLTDFIEMCENATDAEVCHLIKEGHYLAHEHPAERPALDD